MGAYDVINPSDPYTFEAPDLEIAAAAIFLVGGGHYAAEPFEKGQDRVPIFLFGGSDEWAKEKFGADLETWFNRLKATRLPEICAALESFLYGGRLAREDWQGRSIEERAAYNERHRTSMNNIGKRAFSIAASLRSEKEAA